MKILGYYLIDFKWLKKIMHPLELGDALYKSDYSGYDALANTPMQHLIFEHLASQSAHLKVTDAYPRNFKETIDFNEYYSNASLPSFKDLTSPLDLKSKKSDQDDLDAILVHNSPNTMYTLQRTSELNNLIRFLNLKNRVLNSHDILALCAQDKVLFSVFLKMHTSSAGPQTQIIDLDFYQINDLNIEPESYYIFKATNQHKAEGSFIVMGKEIPSALLALKNRDSESFSPVHDCSERFKKQLAYWRSSECNRFVVLQKYVSSDPLHVNDNHYDPTGRAVFAVMGDDKDTQIVLLDGYWKLPRQPVSEHLSISSSISHISSRFSNRNSQKTNSVLFTDKEKELIQKQLHDSFLNIMIRSSPTQLITTLASKEYVHERDYFLKHSDHLSFEIDHSFIEELNSRVFIEITNREHCINFMLDYCENFSFQAHLEYINLLAIDWLHEHLNHFNQDQINRLKILVTDFCKTSAEPINAPQIREHLQKQFVFNEQNQSIEQPRFSPGFFGSQHSQNQSSPCPSTFKP